MARYEILVDAYYSDGARTIVKFHMHNYSEFYITYTDYAPNDKRSRNKSELLPTRAASVHQLFACANAAIAGYRFAKWYYENTNGCLTMPHFPTVRWNMDAK